MIYHSGMVYNVVSKSTLFINTRVNLLIINWYTRSFGPNRYTQIHSCDKLTSCCNCHTQQTLNAIERSYDMTDNILYTC